MKKGTIAIIAGLLLIAAALGLAAYNYFDGRRADAVAQSVLQALKPQIAEGVPMPDIAAAEDPGEIEYPDYVLNPQMEMPWKLVNGSYYIGVLNIPALQLELPVQYEWDYEKLKDGPCRYWGSAYLNNLVIAAHNYDRHFGDLDTLKLGDAMSFTDIDGNVFNYKLIEITTLDSGKVEEVISADCGMTLFTCTLGGQNRVIVRCELVK